MRGVVYKITNLVNGKIYVGQTIRTLERRWYHHVYCALKGGKDKFARAIRKYGADAFVPEVLEETDMLDEKEREFIRLFDSVKKGYNTKIGGDGGPHHASTKKKIARANRKRVWTKEMRATMSLAIKKWHNKRGFVPKSEEFRRKISEANRGRKMPEASKKHFQEYNNKKKKPVLCLDTGEIFESIMAACKKMNLNDGHLRMHLKGRHSHIKGYCFAYLS